MTTKKTGQVSREVNNLNFIESKNGEIKGNTTDRPERFQIFSKNPIFPASGSKNRTKVPPKTNDSGDSTFFERKGRIKRV
jgi:hypothetical protein